MTRQPKDDNEDWAEQRLEQGQECFQDAEPGELKVKLHTPSTWVKMQTGNLGGVGLWFAIVPGQTFMGVGVMGSGPVTTLPATFPNLAHASLLGGFSFARMNFLPIDIGFTVIGASTRVIVIVPAIPLSASTSVVFLGLGTVIGPVIRTATVVAGACD